MSKHTPGPWVQRTPNGANQTALIVRELPNYRRTVVAVIPDHRPFGDSAVKDPMEMEYNASLVAAAPEMLAALQAIAEMTVDGGAIKQLAQAAIRKALKFGNLPDSSTSD